MPRRRASLAGVVFALLVVATLAAFAWSQRLKRDPLVLDRVSFVAVPRLHPAAHPRHAFTPNRDCRHDRMRIRFRMTQSDRADVQIVKPGGKLIVTLARDEYPEALHLLHLLLGRQDPGWGSGPSGPLQAAGENARPGPDAGPGRGDATAQRSPPAPEGLPSHGPEPGARLERRPGRGGPAGRLRGGGGLDPASGRAQALGGDVVRRPLLPAADPRRSVELDRRSPTSAKIPRGSSRWRSPGSRPAASSPPPSVAGRRR